MLSYSDATLAEDISKTNLLLEGGGWVKEFKTKMTASVATFHLRKERFGPVKVYKGCLPGR